MIAVEPIAEMREVFERRSGAEALEGTAEAIPLADGTVDAVTAAQAFHWFDPERALPEMHRVLAARRRLADLSGTSATSSRTRCRPGGRGGEVRPRARP